MQIWLSRKQSIEEFRWRKRDRAISYSVFKNPEYREARNVVAEALGSFARLEKPLAIETIDNAKSKDRRLSQAMLLVISHWGRMSTEIELGLIDEEAAFRYHATAMSNVYLALHEFICQREQLNPYGNPDLCSVGNRWLKRRGKKVP